MDELIKSDLPIQEVDLSHDEALIYFKKINNNLNNNLLFF
jgi:hypothetical protein